MFTAPPSLPTNTLMMWRKLPWYVKLSEAINVYGPPSPTNQYVDNVKKVDIVSQITWSYK